MAFSLTAAIAEGFINQIDLTWADAAGSVTLYRSTTVIDISGETVDVSSATKVGEGLTGEGISDYPDAGTYYYYATDGTAWTGATGTDVTEGAITVPATNYAPEIQKDYQATNIVKVSQSDAERNALNNAGRITFNPIVLPSGKNMAIVVIVGTAGQVTEAAIGSALYNKCDGFAVLQDGAIKNFTGYEAKLSGSTQIKYDVQKS